MTGDQIAAIACMGGVVVCAAFGLWANWLPSNH